MKKAYKFYNDTYFQTFIFLPNWTRDDLIKTFKLDPDEDGRGMVFYHNGAVFIWIQEFTYENLGYLAHEATHAANCMFREKGVKISTSNDEPLAYMVGYVFENCMKYFKKKSTRRKKV